MITRGPLEYLRFLKSGAWRGCRNHIGLSVVELWAAMVCRYFAPWVLIGPNILAIKLNFDDPLEATRLHGGWGFIGSQVTELSVTVGWVRVTMGPLFHALHKLKMLGILEDEEITGLDISSDSGYAYPVENHPRFYADYMRMQKNNHD
ncbi:hypothetical protein AB3S75_041372 [Citrus x aurantiifolia]